MNDGPVNEGGGHRGVPVQAVLFICSLNAVRSPMAEALGKMRFGRQLYFDSAGLRKSDRDTFALSALREMGIDFERDESHTFDEVDFEGFDIVVALSPEAHDVARERLRATSVELLFWSIEDATEISGTREQRMLAYRGVRDKIDRLIKTEIGPRLNK